MKRLLNTLYITSANRYLSLDGENVVISEKNQEIGRVPLHNLEMIVTFSYTGASPALMGACAARGIGLVFLSAHGRFLARVTGEVYGNVTLRKERGCKIKCVSLRRESSKLTHFVSFTECDKITGKD